MNRLVCISFAAICWLSFHASSVYADILFESGTLGPTGLAQGSVPATNITPNVFTGVRFQLTQPVITEQVGGHFVDTANGTFFGAIVVRSMMRMIFPTPVISRRRTCLGPRHSRSRIPPRKSLAISSYRLIRVGTRSCSAADSLAPAAMGRRREQF